MSKDVWIVSGMTDSVSYCFYSEAPNKNDVPTIKKQITIRGGRGLPSSRSGFGERSEDAQGMPLWTADGIITRVSALDFAELSEHPHFKRHLAAGRVKIVRQNIEGNHKAVREISRDMPGLDSHAQLTPSTHKQRVKVKVGEDQPKDEFRI